MAKTLNAHRERILNWFNYTISGGLIVGIDNESAHSREPHMGIEA